jgi:hypothetical protein
MSTYDITCGSCGKGVAAQIVASSDEAIWLECPSCREGSVVTSGGFVYPSAPAGKAVANLPSDVDAAWREARITHAVGAYTASEIICRKILMHLAVDVVPSDPGRSFAQYVDDLNVAGYIAKGVKPAIDKIRVRGNIANHELPQSTEQDSLRTLGLTEHLLSSIYEMAV